MTKRILLPVLAVTALGVSLTGCVPLLPPVASGPRVTEDRDIEAIESVQIGITGDLVVKIGDTPSLTITASRGALDRLTSKIVDGVLVLGARGPGFVLGEIDYVLTVPWMSSISIAGSSDVTADFTGADDVTIEIDGSGDVHGTNIDATTVTASVSGSGDIDLTGTADVQLIEIDGSADVSGADLVTRATKIDLSGSGDLEVHATETLDVDLSGSGSVRYSGGAQVTSDISGSGSVVAD